MREGSRRAAVLRPGPDGGRAMTGRTGAGSPTRSETDGSGSPTDLGHRRGSGRRKRQGAAPAGAPPGPGRTKHRILFAAAGINDRHSGSGTASASGEPGRARRESARRRPCWGTAEECGEVSGSQPGCTGVGPASELDGTDRAGLSTEVDVPAGDEAHVRIHGSNMAVARRGGQPVMSESWTGVSQARPPTGGGRWPEEGF